MTEDEMIGWHHGLDGHELSKLWELVMDRETCTPWGHKELDTAERLIYNSFIFRPTLTSIHDYWKNHSFDATDLLAE